MLTYRDIINSFTLKLRRAFSDAKIFVDDTVNGVNEPCFYVQIIPNSNAASTLKTNRKSVSTSIKYYGDKKTKKLDLLDMANKLENEFSRTIEIKDRKLTISNTEAQPLKDEVGWYLDFLVTINYCDDVYMEEVDYDNMENVNMNYNLKSKEDGGA